MKGACPSQPKCYSSLEVVVQYMDIRQSQLVVVDLADLIYSFNIILAFNYIVLGTGPDCKPAPVPGLLNLGSNKNNSFSSSTASRVFGF